MKTKSVPVYIDVLRWIVFLVVIIVCFEIAKALACTLIYLGILALVIPYMYHDFKRHGWRMRKSS